MLHQSFPDPVVLTITLAFLGLAAALGLAAVSALLLFQTRRRGAALAYLAMAGVFTAALVRVLTRALGGVVCFRSPLQTVLLYGGLIALHLYFIWDTWRTLRQELALPCELDKEGEKP